MISISVRNCVKVQVTEIQPQGLNQIAIYCCLGSKKPEGRWFRAEGLVMVTSGSCSAILSMWLSSKKRGEGRAKRIIESALFNSEK